MWVAGDTRVELRESELLSRPPQRGVSCHVHAMPLRYYPIKGELHAGSYTVQLHGTTSPVRIAIANPA